MTFTDSNDSNTSPAASERREPLPTQKNTLTGSQQASETLRQRLDFLFLVVALGTIAVTSMRHAGLAPDVDIWWHIRTGDWIFQHGFVPNADIFSSSTMGKPWIVYTWLFDLLTAKLFGSMAYRGILLMTAGLTVLSMAAMTALLARYTYMLRAVGLATAAYVAMVPLSAPRPWLFTILFFSVEFWLLLQACESSKRKWLYPIVPLMILWANIHIQFVYGLALIGLFALHESVVVSGAEVFPVRGTQGKLSAAWLWALFGAASLATLANPYGWRLYIVAYQYTIQRAPLDLIQEMQAPAFRSMSDWFALGLACLAWFALGSARRKPLLLLALMIAASWCGFRSARDVWFTVIVASIILARWLQPDVGRRTLSWKGWTAALAFASVFVIFGVGASNTLVQKRISELYPAQACDFVETHHLPRPIYNSYNWGGYLLWRLPEMDCVH